jgi:tetratricopeptide (TPR) repeat protein
MRRALCLILALGALTWAAPGDRPVAVELKNGKRIFGRVVESECTDDVLVIREIRSKVKRTVKWSEIKDKVAHKLRVDLGFEVEARESGLKIAGVEITNKAGSTFQGLLVNAKTAQKDGVYILKRADGERRIRATDVRDGPREIMMDALEVYTPLELYEQRIKEKPPETAEDHFQLGDFAAFVGALEQAKMHFEKVLEMGSTKFPESLVNRHLERVKARLANAEAENALKLIRQHTWRKRWKQASEGIAAFKENYKDDEGLIKDVERLDAALKEKRQDYFTGAIPRLLRDTVKKLIAKKVREPELTLKMAQDYAGGEAGDEETATAEALAAVGEKLGITPEEVVEFWKLRRKRTVYKAFYRDGTFIVIDNLEDALAKAPKPPSGKNTPKPPKPSPIQTPDGWWDGKIKARKYSEARDWLYAWWAENAGMVELMDPKKENCQTCAGKGWTQAMIQTSQGSIPFFNRCQNCHMAKHFRVVRFK